MSRHRKIKALDYDDEYDDYYGALDDDEDFDEDAFEAKFLSSGIDLNVSNSNSISNVNKCRENIDEVDSSPVECSANSILSEANVNSSIGLHEFGKLSNSHPTATTSTEPKDVTPSTTPNTGNKILVDSINSDLTKLAIQHLDKRQWQLPLMEMDKRFRDKTYYKHYSETYINSLRSKLGHFLTDNQLITNPMKYHIQQEKDNYSKYSRMFELLTEYYQSLGGGFFSFATPSPDEEIVIGCRLGTKVKKQVPKQNQSNSEPVQKTTRFEYQGNTANSSQQKTSTSKNKKSTTSKPPTENVVKRGQSQDLTIQENYTAEQLDQLSKKYRNSMKLDSDKKTIPSAAKQKQQQTKSTQSPTTPLTGNKSNTPVTNTTATKTTVANQPRQLTTLVEKRQNLKQQLVRNAEPSAADKEAVRKQAEQAVKEFSEFIKSNKPRVNLVVVGHVDAGKSTLVGHLLYKLGQISGKQMHRFEVDSQRSGKASFKFAWAMDETAEERARGVTIDVALTQFETSKRDVILLDAPGHVDFIPAVISGAAQADAALLVVDATRGEFETGFTSGGQTREHTFLVRSLGVKSLIVVVNKMDNVNWDWCRFLDIKDQLKPFLKQVGFNTEEDVQFIACSGLSGENIMERRIVKAKKSSSHPQLEGDGGEWSSMLCLLEAIDNLKQPERLVEKPTRVSVTDVFKGMSSGVFLGAKVVGGKIENKQKLILLPPNETCEIKQIEVRDSKSSRAFAGDIITAVATGIDINKYYRGCMLCDPLSPCHVTNRFQVRIMMFQNINAILIKGSSIEVHINGTFESGIVRKLISLLNKSTGELIQKKPRCIAKNSSAIIQLKLDRVVCCELYEDNKDLGRIMMRTYGKTIAAGLITKIKSPKIEKSKTKMKSK